MKFSSFSVNRKDDFLAGERMINFAKDLYPLNRSIMGPDIRKSFKYFSNLNHEYKSLKFRTGEKVFDWEIPEEWIVRDAYIEHESGKRFAEFKKNNLHLVGYSIPVNDFILKDELISKIYTLPRYPNAIPYVTSYYKQDWGFCLSHKDYACLPDGKYKVIIDTEHKPGDLCLLEAIIPGESDQEIFFSSYLCHPSMANNELSGPVVLNELLAYVKSIKDRRYTYRFVLLPETIGSISYLSKRLKTLQSKMICGFNLTCLGDENSYSHIESRLGNNLADIALDSALIGLDNCIKYSFLHRGSDERQYCAPGIDLPLCTFCRSKFGEYPEYHTSEDDFNLVTSKGLRESYKVLKNIINAFEIGRYPSINILAEPQLGKRNLYPSISNVHNGTNPAKVRMDILAYCDSNHDIFQIADKVNVNIEKVVEEIVILNKHNIIQLSYDK